MMRLIIFSGIITLSLLSSGCYSMYYSQYDEEEFQQDSSAMSIEDVVKLSNEGIGDDVIISQIRTTRSYFGLNTNDIVELKKVGVSEKVINEMIKTSEPRGKRRIVRDYYSYPYYSYPYYYPYYYSHYGYPWYSSFNLGFYGSGHYRYRSPISHYSPYSRHYSRGYYSGHGYQGNYIGGHRSITGHRPFGRH